MPHDFTDAHQFATGRHPAGVEHFALRRTVDPADTAVSLEDIKCFLRLQPDDDSDDVMLGGALAAATEYVEVLLGRSLVTQTWEYQLDRFPLNGLIKLPRPPAISVTSITYTDTDGNTQTLATSEYQTDFDSEPGRITEAVDKTWPTTQGDDLLAVKVTYTAGYGADTTNVPKNIQFAIMYLIQDMYDNREAQIIGTIAKDNSTVMRLLGVSKQPRFY